MLNRIFRSPDLTMLSHFFACIRDHGDRGVYLDCDMQCVGSLVPLHQNDLPCCFYAGYSNTGSVEINNAIIGCWYVMTCEQ